MADAYLVAPTGGAGPGVLVLHSWWGLTPWVRRLCDRLADEGFTALAPDLNEGFTTDDVEEARSRLLGADLNPTAGLVMASAGVLSGMPATGGGPIGVLGFSMGASWALWLSARRPADVGAVVAFYGTQDIDFQPSRAAYLGHFAEHDELVSPDDVVFLEASLHVVGREVTFHDYPGTSHWFFEEDRPEHHDPAAAAVAWRRSIRFLHEQLDAPDV